MYQLTFNYYMKVLITGSAGFLGGLITDSLLEKSISVVGLDRMPGKERESEFFRFYDCSVVEKERLETIFRRENPTHVLHFACSCNKIRDKKKEYEIDIGGSENVLEVCTRTLSVRQLIFSSSAAAYGGHRDNKEWLSESDPLRPGKYRYGLNKKTVEEIYFREPPRPGLHIASLRFPTILGPEYCKPRSVVSILVRFPYLPAFCLTNRLQFLHSDDLTGLLGLILESGEIDGIYNFAPNNYAVVNEIVPDKKILYVPLFLIKSILWVTWHLRLANLQPEGVRDAAYPMLINPGKLLAKYPYKFRYTSSEAFKETRHNNQLPAEGWF
jgi:UDP-glucose 4-epimerase